MKGKAKKSTAKPVISFRLSADFKTKLDIVQARIQRYSDHQFSISDILELAVFYAKVSPPTKLVAAWRKMKNVA